MSSSDIDDAAIVPVPPEAEKKEAETTKASGQSSDAGAETLPASAGEGEAPKKRRPRRKKTTERAVEGEAAAPVAAEASEPVADVAPVVAPVTEAPAEVAAPPVAAERQEPQERRVEEPVRTSQDDGDDEEDEEDEPDEEEDDLDRARRAAEREQRNAPPPEPIRFADVISGQFDADEESPEVPPLKRVLLPEADSPKLHKVLAQAGLGSRLEMEQLILQGRISVNNEPAHIGQRIQYGDQVKINGKPIRYRIAPPPPRVIAYHKPVGEVVTHDDPQNRPTVFRKLPRLHQGKWQSVGRLDINTEGLLLFTNSGDLANRLMHPRFGVEREYAVRVLGTLDEEQREQLLEGIDIDGQRAAMRSVEDGGGEGANHWYRVVITEGRNREVRRMFESLGLAVSRLIRIRYGCVVLPRGLRRGVWVDLPAGDLQTLHNMVGGAPSQQGNQGNGARPNNRNNKQRNRSRDRGPREGGPQQQQQQEPRRRNEEGDDNDTPDFASIPNPLQQTYDRRAIRDARRS